MIAINVLRSTGWLCLGLLLFASREAQAAAPKSETLLPATTVGYLSVNDAEDLEARWLRTQLGQFTQDPSLDPFIERMRESLAHRMGNLKDRLGITPKDLHGVAGGELAWAMVSQKPKRAVSVLLIDTTGNEEKRDALIAKIDAHLVQRKSKKSTTPVAGIDLTTYDVPPKEGEKESHTAAYFIHDDLLCVADSVELASLLAKRVAGEEKGKNLADVSEYIAVMERCRRESKTMRPDLRWFVKPFPLADAMRTIRPQTTPGEDRLEQLREQGFDAVLGIGGFVHVSFDTKHDFIHRTAIYAPADSAAPEGQKYRLGMNIFKLPNKANLDLHSWTPRTLARYTTVNIDLLHAFDHVHTLFDTMVAGYDGAFQTAMERFEKDPLGPKIKCRDQLLASLGHRVCLMTDYALPIQAQSERFLLAIEVKPGSAETLRTALGKYLEKDGYLEKKLLGHDIWEIQPEEEDDFEEALGGGIFDEEEPEEVESDRLLTRSAVCIANGQLYIASDVEFLRLVFEKAPANEALAKSFDYLSVAESLTKLSPKAGCSRSFQRMDETLRPTYVLLHEGRMPESESFFGRFINELLTTPDDQKNQLLRKQRIDGSKLPPFELARRYFGPTGRTVRTVDDGWFITGVVLNKAAD